MWQADRFACHCGRGAGPGTNRERRRRGSRAADLRVRHKDGSWRSLEATFTNVLADPSVGGVVVNARDVTDRRRAEEALRLRDRAVAAATDGILIADAAQPDWPVIGVNPGFQRITGYPAAEILGHNGRFLQGPGTERAAVAEIRRALEEGRKCTVTLLNYRKDGTPFGNELRLAPVRDEAGQLTHVVGVQSDVTERKRAEAALGAAEVKYRTLVEQMPAITHVSPPARRRAPPGGSAT